MADNETSITDPTVETPGTDTVRTKKICPKSSDNSLPIIEKKLVSDVKDDHDRPRSFFQGFIKRQGSVEGTEGQTSKTKRQGSVEGAEGQTSKTKRQGSVEGAEGQTSKLSVNNKITLSIASRIRSNFKDLEE